MRFYIEAIILSFLVSSVHSLTDGDRNRIYNELDWVIRNDIFLSKVASVEAQNHLYSAARVELEKSRNDPEIVNCLTESIKESTLESQSLVNSTFGSIQGTLSGMKARLDTKEATEGDYMMVDNYLKQLNYKNWREVMIKRYRKRVVEWVPEQRNKMDKCIENKWNR